MFCIFYYHCLLFLYKIDGKDDGLKISFSFWILLVPNESYLLKLWRINSTTLCLPIIFLISMIYEKRREDIDDHLQSIFLEVSSICLTNYANNIIGSSMWFPHNSLFFFFFCSICFWLHFTSKNHEKIELKNKNLKN